MIFFYIKTDTRQGLVFNKLDIMEFLRVVDDYLYGEQNAGHIFQIFLNHLLVFRNKVQSMFYYQMAHHSHITTVQMGMHHIQLYLLEKRSMIYQNLNSSILIKFIPPKKRIRNSNVRLDKSKCLKEVGLVIWKLNMDLSHFLNTNVNLVKIVHVYTITFVEYLIN